MDAQPRRLRLSAGGRRTDTYTDPDLDAYCHADSDGNANSVAYPHSYADSHTGKGNPNAATARHASAAADSLTSDVIPSLSTAAKSFADRVDFEIHLSCVVPAADRLIGYSKINGLHRSHDAGYNHRAGISRRTYGKFSSFAIGCFKSAFFHRSACLIDEHCSLHFRERACSAAREETVVASRGSPGVGRPIADSERKFLDADKRATGRGWHGAGH
jgi:hypothetical protein